MSNAPRPVAIPEVAYMVDRAATPWLVAKDYVAHMYLYIIGVNTFSSGGLSNGSHGIHGTVFRYNTFTRA